LGGAATAILALQDLSAGTTEIYAFWIALSTTSASSCLMIWENGRMEAAKLISENRILHICAATVMDGEKNNHSGIGFEVFVSCFGILLNDKVIKFNQDRIQLKRIEIEQNYIILTYGAKRKTRTIRLLHPELDENEIRRITDKFHYETGISPEVTRKKGGSQT
jgi:hypothetical protein